MSKSIDILLVEDNPADVLLTKKAFAKGKLTSTLHVVVDGVQALDFLHKRPPFADAVTPDIILLDLNLPRKSGREVLQDIKVDDDLKTIPVVVLTTSDADADITASYQLHANCYITKPVDLKEFIRVATLIEDFWVDIVRLPRRR